MKLNITVINTGSCEPSGLACETNRYFLGDCV